MERSDGRVLVVDDEPALLKTFRYCLEDDGHEVATASQADHAEQLVQQRVFDLCFLDLRLGETSALDVLPRLKIAAPWMRIVIVTAYSSIDTAVQAMRAGAADYLVKPCSAQQQRLTATRPLDARRMELRLAELERTTGSSDATQLESRSPAMMKVLEMARQVAHTDANVLILGESGTGKGVIARALHGWSERAKRPFVTVNSPGLSGELFESELFGHRKGAFTGATQNSEGRVSTADGGTLFLDEVGDVPLALQPKLLRFLQDHQYERIGDPVTRQADVRLIAATNRELVRMVSTGTFREDLLYRLDVIRLQLPPLRERSEDIPVLAQSFLAQFVAAYRRPARHFSKAALDALSRYHWPGNVRELRNIVERASILASSECIEPHQLALGGAAAETTAGPRRGRVSLQTVEREHIVATLAGTATLEEAARVLDIDVSTLYRKRKQYGV